VNIKIKFFGGFEPYLRRTLCEIQIPASLKIKDLRVQICDLLAGADIQVLDSEKFRELVRLSAFADETQILSDEAEVSQNTQLAVLPPVCGG